MTHSLRHMIGSAQDAKSLDRLREAITKADLQIGDGHIEAARTTLHAAMDETSTDTVRPSVSNGHTLHAFTPSDEHLACAVCGYARSERLMHFQPSPSDMGAPVQPLASSGKALTGKGGADGL